MLQCYHIKHCQYPDEKKAALKTALGSLNQHCKHVPFYHSASYTLLNSYPKE